MCNEIPDTDIVKLCGQSSCKGFSNLKDADRSRIQMPFLEYVSKTMPAMFADIKGYIGEVASLVEDLEQSIKG